MIKIYVNEVPLILASAEEAKAFSPSKTLIKSRYQGKHKYLYHFIDNLEKGKKVDKIVLYSNKFDQLKAHFWDILTVKEAAALQTFPKDYVFSGPTTAQYRQIGNAMPVALATEVADVVAYLLDTYVTAGSQNKN